MQKTFKSLPDEEKKYWHSHSFEVESGMLTVVGKAGVPGECAVPEVEKSRSLLTTEPWLALIYVRPPNFPPSCSSPPLPPPLSFSLHSYSCHDRPSRKTSPSRPPQNVWEDLPHLAVRHSPRPASRSSSDDDVRRDRLIDVSIRLRGDASSDSSHFASLAFALMLPPFHPPPSPSRQVLHKGRTDRQESPR